MGKQTNSRKISAPVIGTLSDVSETLKEEFTQNIPKTALRQLGWENFLGKRKQSGNDLDSEMDDLFPGEKRGKEQQLTNTVARISRETILFSNTQRQKEMEIQGRLGRIRTQISTLAREVSIKTSISVEQEIQSPGIGHLNFFEKLLSAFEKIVMNFKDMIHKGSVAGTSKTPHGMVNLRRQRKNALSGSGESVGTNYTSTQMG